MDTSEQYIKMCEKAGEIQKLNPAKEDVDVLWDALPYTGIAYQGDNVFCEMEDNTMIWLPCQDELQEMVVQDLDGEITRVQLLRDFFFFCSPLWSLGTMPHKRAIKEAEKQKAYIGGFNSFEQLWLAFVMKELYSKQWDGEDWRIVKKYNRKGCHDVGEFYRE